MIFGIDLGTTNSLIGTGDTLLTGLVSSKVDVVQKKHIQDNTVTEDIVASYKTNMSMGGDGQLSIQCSAIVLKDLAEMATRRYGEPVKDVVISVPAYFSTSQREAVYKAAEIAGLNLKSLINEPTAAALYLCRDKKDIYVVYDLGGGTFDISIIDSRMGTYSVIATDGIVLGGDDLDRAMAEKMIKEVKIPIRYRNKLGLDKLKNLMRAAKEEIQQTRNDVYVNLSEFGIERDYVLTPGKYVESVRDVFGKTIDMTNYIISKNVPACEKPKVVFVGGSASCPYLKEMLKAEISLEEVVSDINPDLIVAKGVAIYAKMLYEGKVESFIEDVTKRLCIEDANGRSLTIIDSNTIVPCRNTITVSNDKAGDKLRLKLYQGDSMVAKNNAYIGTLVYDYDRFVEANDGVVEVSVEVSPDGVISLTATDVLFGDESMQTIELQSR